MKTVIIVSKCLSIDGEKSEAQFHFKGVCAGEVLRDVRLTFPMHLAPDVGQEYLMYVRMTAYEKGVLYGVILKLKLLDNSWDQVS